MRAKLKFPIGPPDNKYHGVSEMNSMNSNYNHNRIPFVKI